MPDSAARSEGRDHNHGLRKETPKTNVASEVRPDYEKLVATHGAQNRVLCFIVFLVLCFAAPSKAFLPHTLPFSKMPSVSLLGTLSFACTSQPLLSP